MKRLSPLVVRALRQLPYLRSLGPAGFQQVSERCEVRECPAGEVLFEQGQVAGGIHVLLSGRVKVVRLSAAGREQVLHDEGAGATFGDAPVFDGGRYVASAIAVEPSTLVVIPRPVLLDALLGDPQALMDAVAILSRRVRKLAAVVEDLALRDVTARVARYLLARDQRAHGMPFRLGATHEALAAKLGTVREEISRALGRLRRRGAISAQRGDIAVLDRNVLHQLASHASRRTRRSK
jgi:CRP/FNR family transcriptional regulator